MNKMNSVVKISSLECQITPYNNYALGPNLFIAIDTHVIEVLQETLVDLIETPTNIQFSIEKQKKPLLKHLYRTRSSITK